MLGYCINNHQWSQRRAGYGPALVWIWVSPAAKSENRPAITWADLCPLFDHREGQVHRGTHRSGTDLYYKDWMVHALCQPMGIVSTSCYLVIPYCWHFLHGCLWRWWRFLHFRVVRLFNINSVSELSHCISFDIAWWEKSCLIRDMEVTTKTSS